MLRCTAALSLLLATHALGAQDTRPSFTVGTATATRGTAATEYTSIVALQRLIPRIDARRLSGTVIIASLVNIARVVPTPPAWLAP